MSWFKDWKHNPVYWGVATALVVSILYLVAGWFCSLESGVTLAQFETWATDEGTKKVIIDEGVVKKFLVVPIEHEKKNV